MRVVSAVCFIVLAGVLVGCSGDGGAGRPDVVLVSGSVKYKGAAVANASVVFVSTSSGRAANGETNAQGEYKLTTFDSNDGAIVGDHVVTITKASTTEGKSPREMTPEEFAKVADRDAREQIGKLLKDQLPEKYGDPKKSGLKRTVIKGESNVFNFDLQD